MNMKNLYKKSVILSILIVVSCSVKLTAQLNLPQGSQLAKVSQRIGITDIEVVYSRPNVNNREIWGSLVPYGMNNLGFGTAKESPWRAGANENTVISFTHDVKVEGHDLPAGKYGLHMIVYENDKATIIFSKNHTAWGSYFYTPEEDAVRMDVNTIEIPYTEQLTYFFIDVLPGSTIIALDWEKKRIPLKIDVNVTNVVLGDIRQKLQDSPGFNRSTWEQAASFSLANGGNLNEALGWINAAIEGQFFSKKDFNNLSIKAGILEKLGKVNEANAIMDEALKSGTVFEIHAYGRQLIAQGNKDRALEVFKFNGKAYKGEWPVDFGLARGYSAVGNYKIALKHLKVAQRRAPDEPNRDAIASYILKLQNNEDFN